jgi:uncharacterized protein YndB with AHSA1/START domain
MKISVSVRVQRPIEDVWTCYTSPEHIVGWNSASDDWHTTKSEVDLRVGGSFSSRMEAKDGSAGFDFAGTYTKVLTNELLGYEFGDRTASVTFTADGAGIVVEVSFDAEDENSNELQRQGWQAILDNFKRYVEAR